MALPTYRLLNKGVIILLCVILLLMTLSLIKVYLQLPNVVAQMLSEPYDHPTASPDKEDADENIVAYDQLPPKVVLAFVAAEDKTFFHHGGVDYMALMAALVESVEEGRFARGSSTITMQLAKSYLPSKEKNLERKISEIFLAAQIEEVFSKQEIIEFYLNRIYFGHDRYGIREAAQFYYAKPVSELNLEEGAMIAGLPQAPSLNNPIQSMQRAQERRNWVLSRMLAAEFIDQEEYLSAVESSL